LFGKGRDQFDLVNSAVLRAKVAAGGRHAWWLKSGWIDRLEATT